MGRVKSIFTPLPAVAGAMIALHSNHGPTRAGFFRLGSLASGTLPDGNLGT